MLGDIIVTACIHANDAPVYAIEFTCSDATQFEPDQRIKVGSEEMDIESISSNTITLHNRGANGTTTANHAGS